MRLAESADVLIDNFRPGVIEAMGFGYATLSARKPGGVFDSIATFITLFYAARHWPNAALSLTVFGTLSYRLWGPDEEAKPPAKLFTK